MNVGTISCFAALLLLAACSSSHNADTGAVADAADVGIDTASPDALPDAAPEALAPGDAADDGGILSQRPYNFRVPANYDPSQPTPLVILLHGYGASGLAQDLYFGLSALQSTRTFLYAYPDGTLDSKGSRFWNATDACCNFDHLPVDDVAYLTAIIDDVSAHYDVDPQRIFLVGHSNGAFMSHRLACDITSRVAAIVSLAGANWQDMTRCQASGPVSILQVHGDADAVIPYAGGQINGIAFPSALDTAAGWAMRNQCTGTLMDTGITLDLDSSLPGAETAVSAYGGCPTGAAGELWTIRGGAHVPALQSTWAATIYDWLAAHPKH